MESERDSAQLGRWCSDEAGRKAQGPIIWNSEKQEKCLSFILTSWKVVLKVLGRAMVESNLHLTVLMFREEVLLQGGRQQRHNTLVVKVVWEAEWKGSG